MSVGKMSTCLELHQAALDRGLKSKFIGTGQAGIMISGDGVPLDAVRVDFASGAVEQQVPDQFYLDVSPFRFRQQLGEGADAIQQNAKSFEGNKPADG